MKLRSAFLATAIMVVTATAPLAAQTAATAAAAPAAAAPAAAAPAKVNVTAGAPVLDAAGGAVGTVASVTADAAIVDTGTVKVGTAGSFVCRTIVPRIGPGASLPGSSDTVTCTRSLFGPRSADKASPRIQLRARSVKSLPPVWYTISVCVAPTCPAFAEFSSRNVNWPKSTVSGNVYTCSWTIVFIPTYTTGLDRLDDFSSRRPRARPAGASTGRVAVSR